MRSWSDVADRPGLCPACGYRPLPAEAADWCAECERLLGPTLTVAEPAHAPAVVDAVGQARERRAARRRAELAERLEAIGA